MIIVEGPDGSGKTTLVRELCKTFSLREGIRAKGNRDKLWETTVDDTLKAITAAADYRKPVKVWDRMGNFSDPIYSNVQHRVTPFSAHALIHLRSLLSAIQAPIILCLPPVEVTVANCGKTTQHEWVKHSEARIWYDYRRALRNGVFPQSVIVYDYTAPKVGHTKLDIEKRIASFTEYRRILNGHAS